MKTRGWMRVGAIALLALALGGCCVLPFRGGHGGHGHYSGEAPRGR